MSRRSGSWRFLLLGIALFSAHTMAAMNIPVPTFPAEVLLSAEGIAATPFSVSLGGTSNRIAMGYGNSSGLYVKTFTITSSGSLSSVTPSLMLCGNSGSVSCSNGALCAITSTRFAAVYQVHRTDALSQYSVHGIVLDVHAGGLSIVDGVFDLSSNTQVSNYSPKCTALSSSILLATWSSMRTSIQSRVIEILGSDIGLENADFQVNSVVMSKQEQPTVAALTTSLAINCWAAYVTDISGYDIFCQLLTVKLSTLEISRTGSAFQVNVVTSQHQEYPDVVAASSKQFLVAWQSESQDGMDGGIFARVYGVWNSYQTPTPIGSEFGVNSVTDGDQTRPRVAVAATKRVVVAWNSDEELPPYKAKGRLIDIFDQLEPQFSSDEFTFSNRSEKTQNPVPVGLGNSYFVGIYDAPPSNDATVQYANGFLALSAHISLHYPENATRELTASSAVMDFGQVEGGTKMVTGLKISNTGQRDLSILRVTISGDGFALVGYNYAGRAGTVIYNNTVLVGESVTIFVSFYRREEGVGNGTLSIYSTDVANSPYLVDLEAYMLPHQSVLSDPVWGPVFIVLLFGGLLCLGVCTMLLPLCILSCCALIGFAWVYSNWKANRELRQQFDEEDEEEMEEIRSASSFSSQRARVNNLASSRGASLGPTSRPRLLVSSGAAAPPPPPIPSKPKGLSTKL